MLIFPSCLKSASWSYNNQKIRAHRYPSEVNWTILYLGFYLAANSVSTC